MVNLSNILMNLFSIKLINFYNEISLGKLNKVTFNNLVHFAFILPYLSVSHKIKIFILDTLILNTNYYFQNNYSLFYGTPLLSLIILINKDLLKKNYYHYQKKLILLIDNMPLSNLNFKDLEYISGLSGLLNYYLIIYENDSSILTKKSYNRINDIITILINYITNVFPYDYEKNLSLTHGIAGILIVLSKANSLSFSNIRINSTILYLQKFLIVNYLSFSKRIPGIIKENNIIFPKNSPSWCYSELGGLHAIILSSNSQSLKQIFINELEKIVLDKDNYKIITPNFCHGYSGLVVFQSLYNIDKIHLKHYLTQQITDSLNIECESLFYDTYYNKYNQMQDEVNFSFLDGSISVLLSILYTLDFDLSIWTKLLLLEF